MGLALKIGVSKEPPDSGIVSCRKVALREKLLRVLVGEQRRMTILVPGDRVKSLSIIEEGGKPDEQYE